MAKHMCNQAYDTLDTWGRTMKCTRPKKKRKIRRNNALKQNTYEVRQYTRNTHLMHDDVNRANRDTKTQI